MSYVNNPQLVTSYDRIDKLSQIVLGQTSPERYVSAQPAGWEARLTHDKHGLTWAVRDMNKPDSETFFADNVKAIRQLIKEQHNKEITDFFAAAAVAWVDYYNKPENFIEKVRANPQLIESIYRCAAKARLHPKDKPENKN